MAWQSPQEKKALFYAKDGRNEDGENEKESRQAIPVRKRIVNRANRQDIQRELSDVPGAPDADSADAAEQSALRQAPQALVQVLSQASGSVSR